MKREDLQDHLARIIRSVCDEGRPLVHAVDELVDLVGRERERAVAEFGCQVHGPGAMSCELCNFPTD